MLLVDTVRVLFPDLRHQVASFLQNSDIHLSLKHSLTACCLKRLGVMSRTFTPMFHNGQEDHNTRRTLTLSHSAMPTFTPAKSLKAPYQSICSPEKDESLFGPSRFYRLYWSFFPLLLAHTAKVTLLLLNSREYFS